MVSADYQRGSIYATVEEIKCMLAGRSMHKNYLELAFALRSIRTKGRNKFLTYSQSIEDLHNDTHKHDYFRKVISVTINDIECTVACEGDFRDCQCGCL
eukprot:m.557893 g.557893  ORF g.557893 m.557893 type:complete len:99 (-) comp22192_c1_seq2:24-320(-)